jgi:DNA-3-methyladenine glycosylase II
MNKLPVIPQGEFKDRKEKIQKLMAQNGIDINSLEKKGEKFRPYRSVVAWYCWRALD